MLLCASIGFLMKNNKCELFVRELEIKNPKYKFIVNLFSDRFSCSHHITRPTALHQTLTLIMYVDKAGRRNAMKKGKNV